MGLVVTFNKSTQKSCDPNYLLIKHEGKTLRLKVYVVDSFIKVHIDGDRSFIVHRADYDQKHATTSNKGEV